MTATAALHDRYASLMVSVECVLLDYLGELSGPTCDANLAELAHCHLALVGDDAPAEIREALARAEVLAGLCERCGGDPCSECGECPRQGCWDCQCEQRRRDEDNERKAESGD